MLSKRVNVNVYGELRTGVYSGYANGEGINHMACYILSHKEQEDFLKGIVIAVATLKGNVTKLIIAPENEIYYEPEIREKLSSLRNVELEDISCLYEKSCGAIIIYKESESTYKVLLVKNHNGRNFSFPKGHVEKGESEKETAIREIKEETGLDVEIIDDFREVSDYTPFGKIKKRVVFFMAQAFSDKVSIQEEELDSYKWVDLYDADKACTYDNDLRVISHAKENLGKLK